MPPFTCDAVGARTLLRVRFESAALVKQIFVYIRVRKTHHIEKDIIVLLQILTKL